MNSGLIRAPQGMRAAQLMIAISAVLYGTQGIFAALAYDHGSSVGVLLAVRAALFCVLALFLFNRRRRDTLRGHRRPVVIACITSVVGPLLYFAAVARMDPATVTLILFIYPALTVIGARLLGRIHLTASSVVVTVVTLIGVALAIGSPVGGVDPIGVALTLAFAVVVSTYFLVAEEGLEGADPLAWLGITVLAAAVFFVPSICSMNSCRSSSIVSTRMAVLFVIESTTDWKPNPCSRPCTSNPSCMNISPTFTLRLHCSPLVLILKEQVIVGIGY
jgi:drug/metabolite transporter (DMT)-like permease